MGSFLLLSLVATVSAASYSDDFSREKMFPLTAAAYSDTPQICLSRLFQNSTFQRQVTVKCDAFKSDTCSGYTAVLNADKAIVLSFRGTQGFLQLIEEANKTAFRSWSLWLPGGKVSKYFYDAFMRIWKSGMNEDFAKLKSRYPSYDIWVTGHSLGGSMATLAASHIVGTNLVPGNKVKLVTYGQPRTGNKEFAHDHDTQLEYSFRVTHWRDMVPHVPNENFEGYFHHKSEVFYKDKMKSNQFKVCGGDEDKKCSDGLWMTASIDDHLHYFGKDISVWGKKGCQ